MEVHAHTHTARKKWTHYFWEFLMLFLAVFCGFLAENIREHKIEHQRAKQYAMSLAEEIAGDTAELSRTIAYYKDKTGNIDTLIKLMNGNIQEIPGGTLYYYAGNSMASNYMIFNRTTLEQLINSGVLRYFTKRALIKTIGEYDQDIKKIEATENLSANILLETRKLQFKIFDAKFKSVYQSSYYVTDADSIRMLKNMQIPLLTYDPKILSEFASWIYMRRANLSMNVNVRYTHIQLKARELLQMLKDEYNLNED